MEGRVSGLRTKAADQQEEDHERPEDHGQEHQAGPFPVLEQRDQPDDAPDDEGCDGGDGQHANERIVLQQAQHLSQQVEQQHGEQRAHGEGGGPFACAGGGEEFHGAPR